MSNTTVGGSVEYALVDYDAHSPKLYPTIYKYLGPHSIKFTESVVMINLAQVNKVHEAFDTINKKAAKKGFAPITFNITDCHPRKAGELRERSVNALSEQTRLIGKRLLEKIERLEKKFNSKTDDINAHLYKKRLVIAAANRELEEARGLAMLFMIEKDVAHAIEASAKIVEAQKKAWLEIRDKHRAEIKKAKAEAAAKESKKSAKRGKAKEKQTA